MTQEEKMAIVHSYEMKAVTREEYLAATDRPEFSMERSKGTLEGYEGKDWTIHKFVIYDPQADCDGWLLWGDDLDELLDETIDGGPLDEGDHPYHVAHREART